MTSPYGLGFLRAWQSRGSQTSYKAQGSKGGCCSDQGRSCMVFYDSFVSYRELLLCSVSFKQVHSESRRQMVDPTSQWKECQAMCSHLKKNFYTDTPINISKKLNIVIAAFLCSCLKSYEFYGMHFTALLWEGFKDFLRCKKGLGHRTAQALSQDMKCTVSALVYWSGQDFLICLGLSGDLEISLWPFFFSGLIFFCFSHLNRDEEILLQPCSSVSDAFEASL